MPDPMDDLPLTATGSNGSGDGRLSALGRRRFLAGATWLTLGAVAGCTGRASSSPRSTASSALPSTSALSTSAPSSALPTPTLMGAVAPTAQAGPVTPVSYQPEGTLTLAAQTSLSEDHFLLAVGTLDPKKDIVVAYDNVDGKVEAMVVHGGVLHQLGRQPAGSALPYSLDPVVVGNDGIAGVTDMVAGTEHLAAILAYKTRVGRLHAVYRAGGEVVHLTAGDQGSNDWATAASATWSWPDTGALQMNYSAYGGLLVYSFTPVVGNKFRMYWRHLRSDVAETGGVVTFDNGDDPQNPVYTNDPSTGRLHVSFRSTGNDSNANIASIFFAMTSDLAGPLTGGEATLQVFYTTGDVTQQASAGPFTTGVRQATGNPQGVVTKVVDVRQMDDLDTSPMVIVTLKGGQVWCASMSPTEPAVTSSSTVWDQGWLWQFLCEPPWGSPDVTVALGARTLPVAEHVQVRPSGDKLLDVYVTQTGGNTRPGPLLTVSRQYARGNAKADSETPGFFDPQPVHAGAALVSVAAFATAAPSLVTVTQDTGALVVLEQDPVTTLWTETTVHLPSTDSLLLSCHRLQVTVSDHRAMPVRGATVSITAAGSISALLPPANSPAGAQTTTTVTLGASAVAAVTDSRGQVTLAIPASGLSVPDVTFVASVKSLSATLTTSPTATVTGYLAGGEATLGAMKPLTPQLLSTARTASGQLLVPAMSPSNLSVSDAVGFVHGAAAAGLKGAPPTRGRSAAPRRQMAVSVPPSAVRSTAGTGLKSGLGDFFGDLFQAIKSGAAQVASVTVATVGGFALTLTTEFGNWAKQKLTLLVNDLESAGHAFHSLLNAIGAEILDCVHWLEAKILAVIKDTVAVAANFDAWIVDWTNWMAAEITKGRTSAEKFFENLVAEVDTSFQELQRDTGLQKVNLGTPPHAAQSGLRATATTTPNTAPPDPHQSWLQGKLVEHQVAPANQPPPLAPSVSTAFDQLVGDLKKNLGTSADSFSKAAKDIFTAAQKIFDNPSQIIALGVPAFLDFLKDLVDGVLKLGEAIVEGALDLAALLVAVVTSVLDTPLPDIPLVSSLLGDVGFTGPLTIGKVATLMMAFPATIAYKIAKLDSTARPFAGVENGRLVETAKSGLSDTNQDIKNERMWVASILVMAWSMIDFISILETASSPPGYDPGSVYKAPGLEFFAGVDIVAPLLIGILTYPTEDAIPFSGQLSQAKMAGTMGYVVGFAFPIITTLNFFWKRRVSDYGDSVFVDKGRLSLTTTAGLAGTMLAIGQVIADAVDGDFDPAALCLALTGNLGPSFAFLADPDLNYSTEGVSSCTVALLTLAGGTISSLLMGLPFVA